MVGEKAMELSIMGPNFSVKQPNNLFCLFGCLAPSHSGTCAYVFPSAKDASPCSQFICPR